MKAQQKNKNSGGYHMSLTKSAIARRLSLLAGSSTALAGLSAAASLGLTLTPGAAFAANECGNPAANGSAADTFVCPVATYLTGIQHTSSGDLSVTVQTGSNFGTGGVVSTAGAAADDLTLRLTGVPSTTGSYAFSTAFPALLNAESQAGDVLVEIEASRTNTSSGPSVTANNAATTRAVRAVSTAGGDVTVRSLLTGSTGIRNGTIQSNVNPNAVAVEAQSIGGGDVTVDLGVGTGAGRLYGIRAQASGAGAVSIMGSGTANTSVAGSAGIYVQAGTGPVTIVGGNSASNGQTAVFINAGGDVNFTGSASGSLYGIDIVNVAANTTTTLALTGGVSGATAAIRAAGAGTLDVGIRGSQSAMNFDFTGMAAPVEVRIEAGGAWRPAPNASTVVPAGNFSINIDSGAALIAGVHTSGSGPTVTNALEAPTVLTFNDPGMVLTNAGYIVVGPDQSDTSHQVARHEAELRFIGLNEFRHSGTILLGGAGYPGVGLQIQGVKVEDTDSWYDDMLLFQDGTWIGEGGNIIYDVDTNLTQVNCTREAVTNDFAAADCLRIVDSTVEGQTYVNIIQITPGDRGRLTQQIMDEGILLIDAPGSTITAENFALDPQMRDYNPASDSLDKGLYQYVLLFDDAAKQFKLFGTLSGAAYQLPMASTAAHGLWRLSTGSWFDRQADLRGAVQDGISGGVWMRASGERADRDVTSISTLGGQQYAIDNNHQADMYAVTGGVDLVDATTSEGMAYVIGFMGGYAHADVDYEVSGNTQAMDAWTAGLYGGLISGGLYVDAAVNANNIILDTDAAGFNFLPGGTILSSRLMSVGGRVEAGWRLPFGDGLFAEPLAGLSYVTTKLDDADIKPDDGSRPGLAVSYEDAISMRAGLGGRIGLDRDFGLVRTQVAVLGRVWNEFEGESGASIRNLAFAGDPDILVTDDFSGRFNELGLGASVYSAGGVVSGFVNLGGKFADDYEAQTGTVGVRVAW